MFFFLLTYNFLYFSQDLFELNIDKLGGRHQKIDSTILLITFYEMNSIHNFRTGSKNLQPKKKKNQKPLISELMKSPYNIQSPHK